MNIYDTLKSMNFGQHDLISLEFDKLAKIRDTYKLVGYVSLNSHLPDCVHLART